MSEAVIEKAEMPSATEWQARCTVGAAKNLAHWVKCTAPDKLSWQASVGPESNTRTVLEQMEECIRVNRRMARWLRGDSSELPPSVPLVNAHEIETELLASAEELADTIRGLAPADIDKIYDTAWGALTGRELMVIPLANMYYHGGQVNYIQTLYGDMDFHFPD